MRKLSAVLSALTLCALFLSGCMFGSVDEMYALPKSSQAYVDLQTKINAEKGTAEFIAPLSGENRQTIQLVDMDGDGVQEAVTFFRDTASDKPLKLVIFRQDERGSYQVSTRIEGVGTEIESVEYLDLDDQPGKDILVGWQAGASLHTLVGYTLSGDQTLEILRGAYSRYLTADLDGDTLQEVILAQTEAGAPAHLRLEYYDGRQGGMELVNTAQLSEGVTDISSWTAGELEGGVPSVFVTSDLEEELLVTDVFTAGEEGLRNISLDRNTRRSETAFRASSGVRPADRNGDGFTDVPVGVPVASYGESAGEQFWWLDWMSYRPDGSRQKVMTTYQSSDGSWYLEIPDTWTGSFSMTRQENAAEGFRSVTFARNEGDSADPFLTISGLSGGDRADQARQEGQFILYADSATVFAAQLLDSGWNCGLDQQALAARFHVGSGPWTGEAMG